MKIKLSPTRSDMPPLIASVNGDVITVNGVKYDLSQLNVGDELPVSEPFIGSIIRDENSVIHLTLALPHGDNAPTDTLFPSAFDNAIDITNGDVPVPPYNIEVSREH